MGECCTSNNGPVPVAIIGPGKVGTAIGVLAQKAGWPVVSVGGRDADRARLAAETIGQATKACSPTEAARSGKLVLITVSDDAIRDVCDELAMAGAFLKEAIVVHCCGAMGSEVLSSARDKCGCRIASMHPLQTFPSVQAAIEGLPGAYFFCEGEESALIVLNRFGEHIGSECVQLAGSGDSKALYHAAAVIACNYMASLVDSAIELMSQAGVDRQTACKALAPLVRATAENVMFMGPEKALTGPIARGQVDTVRRHLQAIRSQENLGELAKLYRCLGLRTVELAQRKGTIAVSVAGEMRQVLAEAEEEL